MLDVVDLRAVCDLAHAAGALVVVDNVFATPLLQKPLELGADVVVYSCTKHIDGQGRVLGGAVLGRQKWVDETLQPFIRNTGPSAVAVQRLAAAERDGDAGAAGRGRLSLGRGDCRISWPASREIARVLVSDPRDHPQHALAMRR